MHHCCKLFGLGSSHKGSMNCEQICNNTERESSKKASPLLYFGNLIKASGIFGIFIALFVSEQHCNGLTLQADYYDNDIFLPVIILSIQHLKLTSLL